jgi:hypothetical protein
LALSTPNAAPVRLASTLEERFGNFLLPVLLTSDGAAISAACEGGVSTWTGTDLKEIGSR